MRSNSERGRFADVETFIVDLQVLSGIADGALDERTRNAVAVVFEALGTSRIDQATRGKQFYAHMNRKLDLNATTLSKIYGTAAALGVTFNYHDKLAIGATVDAGDFATFRRVVESVWCKKAAQEPVLSAFTPASHEQTRQAIRNEAARPSKLRKAHNRPVAGDVFNSAAGALVWSSFDESSLKGVHDPIDTDEPFMERLKREQPALFRRDRSLVVRLISSPSRAEYERARQGLEQWLIDEWATMDNYGHLAAILDVDASDPSVAWELSADLTHVAEHFVEENERMGYFRWREVVVETLEHNSEIDGAAANFEVACIGFTYRDLIAIHDDDGNVSQLVALFQKNERDETIVRCPACRSSQVRGNSYPSFGVKSWECQNPICPERSIYNRGKRYSFKALLHQAAILEPRNQIATGTIREWRRDVRGSVSLDGIVRMLVEFYSMVGDVVCLIDLKTPERVVSGREVREEVVVGRGPTTSGDFWAGPYFARYIPDNDSPNTNSAGRATLGDSQWEVVHGDALDVLAGYADELFDIAMTSPPYFNAREYSQWPNLYCYLYDMHQIHRELFRTLRQGAVYAFNIFDYFDNERTITFSLMGKKRISLSALFVDMFRRIGFVYEGAAVWDKGDIEGKRSFNAGNPSPFYQSPLNCWEHVLLLRKPNRSGAADPVKVSNRVLKVHPVVKMVRGSNVYGHTAPYPLELCLQVLGSIGRSGHVVVDPFAGSGTTARAALELGMRSVMIERDAEYASLAREMTSSYEVRCQAASDQLTLL